MVRLVAGINGSIVDQVLGFNSTMVRLVVDMTGSALLFKKFQFHYGTIGSQQGTSSGTHLIVSIPLWYDW